MIRTGSGSFMIVKDNVGGVYQHFTKLHAILDLLENIWTKLISPHKSRSCAQHIPLKDDGKDSIQRL